VNSERTGRFEPLLIVLALAIIAGFFTNLGAIPLFDLDEGAFSEATRELFERHDFLITTLNGEPRYDKPILFYWLQALSVSWLGWNEFALRLPSALAATVWALATTAFVARVRDLRTGCVAGIVLATSLLISLIGKTAISDATLNCFLAASMFTIYLYYLERRRRYVIATFAFMGLGFLTKGPVAILVPGAVSLVFFGSYGQWRNWLHAISDRIGWLILLVINLPWYLSVYFRDGAGFIEGFFFQHNLGRFDAAMEGHGGSLLYYLPIVLIGTLPYTGLLIPALRSGVALVREPLNRFLLIWFLFVLILFSISGTKLPHYINYGLTGLIILLALRVEHLRSRALALVPAALYLLLLLFLPEILGHAAAGVKQPFYAASLTDIGEHFTWTYRLPLLIAILLVVFLYNETRLSLSSRLFATALVTSLALPGLVLPRVGALLQEPAREAGLFMRQMPDQAVVSWRLNMPSFSVYSNRIVPRRRPEPGEVVFTSPPYLSDLDGVGEILFKKGGVILARIGEVPGAANPDTPSPDVETAPKPRSATPQPPIPAPQ